MHPNERTLALLAGGELGALARWRAQRHVAACPECHGAVAEFRALRGEIRKLDGLPPLNWNHLAAEMKANIRLGLEAGECVALPSSRPWFAHGLFGHGLFGHGLFGHGLFGYGAPIAALASVAALLLAGVMLQRPSPPGAAAGSVQGAVIEATRNGIELKENGQALSLLHGRDADVTLTVSAQGSMRARYVDAETGYVTINNVYVQ